MTVPADARLTTRAEEAAAQVRDPELPMVSLLDLGVLRGVEVDPAGQARVTITPTYTGCPAMATMKSDLRLALHAAGICDVQIVVSLDPPWSTDDMTRRGREALAESGIAPPGPRRERQGPVPLDLLAAPPTVTCPLCGSRDTEELSRFGSTACKALRRCRSCREPFDHFKEL